MSHREATAIVVFVNRRKLELHQVQITVSDLLAKAGFEGESWDLFILQGEGDPTGGEPLQAGAVIDLKNGERFRVIPGNRTFGGW